MRQTDSCWMGGRETGRKKVKGLTTERVYTHTHTHTHTHGPWTQTMVWRCPEGRRGAGAGWRWEREEKVRTTVTA